MIDKTKKLQILRTVWFTSGQPADLVTGSSPFLLSLLIPSTVRGSMHCREVVMWIGGMG